MAIVRQSGSWPVRQRTEPRTDLPVARTVPEACPPAGSARDSSPRSDHPAPWLPLDHASHRPWSRQAADATVLSLVASRPVAADRDAIMAHQTKTPPVGGRWLFPRLPVVARRPTVRAACGRAGDQVPKSGKPVGPPGRSLAAQGAGNRSAGVESASTIFEPNLHHVASCSPNAMLSYTDKCGYNALC